MGRREVSWVGSGQAAIWKRQPADRAGVWLSVVLLVVVVVTVVVAVAVACQ